MKKCLVFVLVIALSVTSVFAAKLPSFGKVAPKSSPISGHFGATVAPTFAWDTYNFGSSTSSKVQTISLDVDVAGATYFNKGDNKFGLGYGLRFDFPLKQKSGNLTISGDDMFWKFGIGPKVTFQYQRVLSKDLNLEAGAGIEWDFYSKSWEVGNTKYHTKMNILSFIANVGIDYKLSKNLGLRAGAEFGIPMTCTYKTGLSGHEAEKDSSYTGFALTPFVGISYLY